MTARKAAIAALLDRARSLNKPAWYLDGPLPVQVAKGKIPDTAVYACVSGDVTWVKLPDE